MSQPFSAVTDRSCLSHIRRVCSQDTKSLRADQSFEVEMARSSAFFVLSVFVLIMLLVPNVLTRRQCPKACRTYITSEIEGKLTRALRVSTLLTVGFCTLIALILYV